MNGGIEEGMAQNIKQLQHAPIGVFDSGVGGLSVLRAIRQLLPAERLLYVADSGHVPYGEKSPEFIRLRSQKIAGFLLGQGAKALVVACNTATAAAVSGLRASERRSSGQAGTSSRSRCAR